MWNPSLFPATTACVLQVGRLSLITLLLFTTLPRYGPQVVRAQQVNVTSVSTVYGLADDVSCETYAADVVVETPPESESSFDGFVEAAGSKKDGAVGVLAEIAPEQPVMLTMAGDTIGGLIGAAKEKGAGFSNAIMSSGTSAWTTLSESELAALLNSTVHWDAYADVMTDHPELQSTAAPAVKFATGLNPDGDISTRAILINAALLAVPASKLGPVLGNGVKQAVTIGPDVLILVDNVVVARIIDGAKSVTGLVEGRIDDFGRVVVRTAPPLQQVLLQDLPVRVQQGVVSQLKKQRSGATPEPGVYFANAGSYLPAQPPGYYREYPVDGPDSPKGGMQRIVIGQNGELYLTEDCGNSYVEIILADDPLNESVLPVESGVSG